MVSFHLCDPGWTTPILPSLSFDSILPCLIVWPITTVQSTVDKTDLENTLGFRRALGAGRTSYTGYQNLSDHQQRDSV